MIFATVFKNNSVSSSTSGESVWPVPITVDAEIVSSSCMSLFDAVAAVVDSTSTTSTTLLCPSMKVDHHVLIVS